MVDAQYGNFWGIYAASALFGTVKTSDGYAIKNLNVNGIVGSVTPDGHYEKYHAASFAAGIVLNLYNASIENCKFTGTIFAVGKEYNSNAPLELMDSYAGGIVDHMYSGSVKNCIVEDASITANPYWPAILKGHEVAGYAGGIVARMESGTIEECIIQGSTVNCISQSAYEHSEGSKDNMRATVHAGGIVGLLMNSSKLKTIKNNEAYAMVSGTTKYGAKHLGGVIGKIDDANLISDSNVYAGSAYGIGYGLGGDEGDDPGCVPVGNVRLSIKTSSLSNGNSGKIYSQTLEAEVEGVNWPVKWKINDGELPDGLELYGETGEISGVPTVNGTFSFTVKASIGANELKELQRNTQS